MKKNYVSIVIPCYNGEKYISKCLDSLLQQSYPFIQIILVNDGSTDNSENIIATYINNNQNSSKEIILINQDNKGQAAAMNKGLKYVTGEYFMWQDVDDWYNLDSVEIAVNYLKETNYNLARGEVSFFHENDLSNLVSIGKSNDPLNLNVFDKYILENDSYCFAGIFITKTSHLDKSIKNREIFISRAGQNWQLILPLSFKEECGYINRSIYNCRIIDSSHSHKDSKLLKNFLDKCDKHYEILYQTLIRIDMSSKEKNFWIKKIKIKYFKRKVLYFIKNSLIYKFFRKDG